MKLLSVAVPCYNMERYLAGCLSSLEHPALRERLEVLVVNDGSQDGSLAIAQAYQRRAPELFRVIDQPNGGHGAAVNAARSILGHQRAAEADRDYCMSIKEILALIPDSL